MDSAFDRDTTVRRLEHDRAGATFDVDISGDWRAGVGPHGGYLAAMLLRALTETVGDPLRGPRSMTVHYARSPNPGPAVIRVVVERSGRSLTTLCAHLEQDGRPMAIALAAFSLTWDGAPELARLAMPEVAPADPQRVSTAGLFDGAPPFTRQLVMQPRVGAIPFSGTSAPTRIGGWLGLPEARPLDALALALFCDAWFPPVFIALSEPAVSPTVDLTIHFRANLSLPAPVPPAYEPDALCMSLFETRLLHDGFFEEDGVIWSADGTVLAQSRQMGIVMARGDVE